MMPRPIPDGGACEDHHEPAPPPQASGASTEAQRMRRTSRPRLRTPRSGGYDPPVSRIPLNAVSNLNR